MSRYPKDFEEKTARGPFGGTYNCVEFFKCMDTNWAKASACLAALLPSELKNILTSGVESSQALKVVERYEDVATFKRFVSDPLERELNGLLGDDTFVVVGGDFVKGISARGDSEAFGVVLSISQHHRSGTQLKGKTFECSLVFRDRGRWDILWVPDADDRTRNDPLWLISSKDTKANGPSWVPVQMRLDMYGKFCVENGWTSYEKHGQQLLLKADLVNVKQ